MHDLSPLLVLPSFTSWCVDCFVFPGFSCGAQVAVYLVNWLFMVFLSALMVTFVTQPVGPGGPRGWLLSWDGVWRAGVLCCALRGSFGILIWIQSLLVLKLIFFTNVQLTAPYQWWCGAMCVLPCFLTLTQPCESILKSTVRIGF